MWLVAVTCLFILFFCLGRDTIELIWVGLVHIGASLHPLPLIDVIFLYFLISHMYFLGMAADHMDIDPDSAEGQRRIEEAIRQENVEQNMENAIEHLPESFAKVLHHISSLSRITKPDDFKYFHSQGLGLA